MSDYSLKPNVTLICGNQGSGKSTFAFCHLLNGNFVLNGIFDDRGQAAHRLNIKHVRTANECEASLGTRWNCFNPAGMFPGCLPGTDAGKNAFRWYCKWFYGACKRGRGRKRLLFDEPWKWCDTRNYPVEFASIVQEGRIENIELIMATQRPEKIPFAVNGEATEVVLFRLQDAKAFEAIDELELKNYSKQEIWDLPAGSFVSFNRVHGTRRAGRVF